MRGRFAVEAPAQADAMLVTVERLHQGALPALRQDPIAILQAWPEVRIVLVPEVGDGDRCSVAGSYRDDTDPPTLTVGMSRSRRRRGFTALHELGHHLQQTDPELGQRLFTSQDSEGFEEESCDAFAARVLLPHEMIADHFDRRGPTADSVVELFRRSKASREACCVRAAEYLTGGGVVVLLDATGTVIFAAPHGMIPPARGSDQSATPLINAALRTRSTVQRDATFVTFKNESTSDTLYGQAAWLDSDYLVAVLVSDNAAWRPFAPPRPYTGRTRLGEWWTCETCGDSFKVTNAPCEHCGEPRCGDGHCGCTTARMRRDRMCDSCQMVLAPSRFEGISTTCRDCS
jgi:Zn-dependent peptidase ImmA (M78 family)